MAFKQTVMLSWAVALSLISSGVMATPLSFTLNGYDLVKVGDPGNAAQVSANSNQNGFGSVANEFSIGKYQVTIGQYAEFLNAVAASDPRGLYNENMNTNQQIRGIERSGSDGSYVYTVVGPNGTNPVGAQSAANRPITFVSWFDAARFANWMANGKPTGVAGSTTTDNGAYDLGDAVSGNGPAKNAINPNTGAAPTFYIPTENEWYKAAYYSPVKGGPGTPGYFLYGTQSDSAPGNGWDGTNALASKDLANQANIRISDRYAVTGGTSVPGVSGNQNVLTDVGAFTNTFSYYGAFDMSGNSREWNDLNDVLSSNRGMRGGDFFNNASVSASSTRNTFSTSTDRSDFGFRLASPVIVPEPSTWVMGLAGIACGGWGMFRRRKQA